MKQSVRTGRNHTEEVGGEDELNDQSHLAELTVEELAGIASTLWSSAVVVS